MGNRVEATFEVTSWDETPFDEGVGVRKLTEALVSKKYSGGIDGTSTTKWLMAYAPDKTATYVGIERIHGTVGGKRGTSRPRMSSTAPPMTTTRQDAQGPTPPTLSIVI